MVKMTPCLSLTLLLILHATQDVSGQKWKVTGLRQYICAVTGSSVVMPCTFSYPSSLKVTKVYWVVNATKTERLHDLYSLPQYQDRVQYTTDMKTTCTLILSDMRVTDTAEYCVRIETNKQVEKWQSAPVRLTVTDLVVHSSGRAIEGHKVRLDCQSHCILGQNSVLWKRDGKNLPGKQINSNELIFPNIKIEDEGNYSCALEDQRDHPSPPVKLKVMYPPRNMSVSVSPSGEIVEGASVTLTCSSDANPQAVSYTWYARRGTETQISSGQIYRITNITSGHRECYYYCVAANQHGSGSSTPVYLDVQYAPKNASVSVSPSGEIVEGTSVTLTCSTDANLPVQNYTWYKRSQSEMSKMSTQQNYTISDISSEHTGYYYCQTLNRYGHSNSPVIHLDVLYPPKWTSAALCNTGDLEEGTSVTLTCSSSDANPPVEIYTWYRKTGDETDTTAVGSGVTFTFTLTSTRAGLYHCEAKNTVGSQNSSPVDILLADSGWQHVALTAGGTLSLLIALLMVTLAVLWRTKRMIRSASGSRKRERNAQLAPDNGPAQRVDSGDSDNVQYASIQLKTSRGEQMPLHSTVQLQPENVVYATVNV